MVVSDGEQIFVCVCICYYITIIHFPHKVCFGIGDITAVVPHTLLPKDYQGCLKHKTQCCTAEVPTTYGSVWTKSPMSLSDTWHTLEDDWSSWLPKHILNITYDFDGAFYAIIQRWHNITLSLWGETDKNNSLVAQVKLEIKSNFSSGWRTERTVMNIGYLST